MSEAMQILVIRSQVFSTLFMVGLIWLIQFVHYPMFADVGSDAFARYEQIHQRLTTWVVGPPMLVEITTAALLLRFRPEGIPAWVVWLGAGLLGVIWISTAFIQVPAHNRLTNGFDAQTHSLLVNSNWIRTIAWTARGLLVTCWMTGRG